MKLGSGKLVKYTNIQSVGPGMSPKVSSWLDGAAGKR